MPSGGFLTSTGLMNKLPLYPTSIFVTSERKLVERSNAFAPVKETLRSAGFFYSGVRM